MRFIGILLALLGTTVASAPPPEYCNKYACNVTVGLTPIVTGSTNIYHSVDNTTFSHFSGYTSTNPTDPNDYQLQTTLVINNVTRNPCLAQRCWIWVHIYADTPIIGYVSGYYEHKNDVLKITYGSDFSTANMSGKIGPWKAVLQLCITNGGGGDCLLNIDPRSKPMSL